MLSFKRTELLEELIELSVGNFRVMKDVIALFVITNSIAKIANSLRRALQCS
tara:strand:+ start:380 stop:535 length:156 start_codon:yes stop_codon:yes gene_type:complete